MGLMLISRACFVEWKAAYALYSLPGTAADRSVTRASLMEVFRGDDDDKCSCKSAVTGNRVQRGLCYYKNKVCVCLCARTVLCILVQMVKEGLVEPSLFWLAVKQSLSLSSSICSRSVESSACCRSEPLISRLGLGDDGN